MKTTLSVSLDDVRAAAERIAPWAHRTPVLTSASLDRLLGAQLHWKCENLQRAGAFKFRGAMNAVSRLSAAELERGVATHSSGNHAAALALAAQLRGARSFIVMPRTAREVKKRAVAGYGGQISFCAPTLEARETTLARVLEETGAVAIHPYNHPDILAGQGTAALELLEDVPDLDTLIAPVGGGGLLVRHRDRRHRAALRRSRDRRRARRRRRRLPLDAGRAHPALGRSAHHRRRPPHLARRAHLPGHPRARRVDRHRERAGDHRRHAPGVGAHEDHHRAVVGGAGGGAAREARSGRRQEIGVILSGGNVDLDDLPWAGSSE